MALREAIALLRGQIEGELAWVEAELQDDQGYLTQAGHRLAGSLRGWTAQLQMLETLADGADNAQKFQRNEPPDVHRAKAVLERLARKEEPQIRNLVVKDGPLAGTWIPTSPDLPENKEVYLDGDTYVVKGDGIYHVAKEMA